MPEPARLNVDELLTHAVWVRRLALGIVSDAATADDVLQETLVTAIERPPRAGVPLGPWLARVARNIALKLRRGDERRARRQAVVARTGTTPPDESLARAEAYRTVVNAVVALDAPYREVVLLRYFDGAETSEIADRLGLPVETVRTRLKRAHAMLRERLGGEDRERSALLALVIGGTKSPRPPALRAARIGAAGAAAGGVLVMKKLVIAAVVVLLLVGGYVAATKSADAPLRIATREESVVVPSTAGVHSRVARADSAPERAAATVAANPVGPRIRGHVVDETGAPVAGATIVAVPAFVGDMRQPAGRATSAKSAADGSFDAAVDDVTPTFRVLAEVPHRAPALRDSVRPGEEVTLALAACAAMTGCVRDMAGTPVAGARVRWTASLGVGAALVRGATTDADGVYRIDGLPPGRARIPLGGYTSSDFAVVAEAEGYARLVVHPPQAGGDRFPATLDLWMVRGCTVTGVVVDGETGAPIAGARVVCAELGSSFPAGGADGLVASTTRWAAAGETKSDEDGKFAFEHVQAEGVFRLDQNPGGTSGSIAGVVVASAPDHADASDDVLVVRDGTRVATRIKLWPAASIEGRVVDTSGAPVAGARVWGFATELRAWLPYIDLPGWTRDKSTSDADGRYRFDSFPSKRGESVAVRLSAERSGETNNVGENSSSVDARARAGETTAVPDLVLGGPSNDNAAVWVRVLDPSGRPVWGATASLNQWQVESSTGRDGRMRFAFTYNRAGIPPKPQRLVVRARGFAPAATPEFTPSREVPPEVTVSLGAAHRASGRVLREDGTPVAGARVLVSDGTLSREALADSSSTGDTGPVPASRPALVRYGTARTNADGSFTVEDLPEGPYWVGASTSDASAIVGPAPTDAADVAVSLRNAPTAAAATGATVDVTVVDGATHVPVTTASVKLQSDDGGDFMTEVRWDERGFTLHRWTGVRDGVWRVDVSAAGLLPMQRTITVTGGAPVAVEIELSRGTTVRGTLTPPPGSRPEDAWVSLRSVDRADVWTGVCRPDTDGRFAISGVPPGRWRASVARTNTPLPIVCAAQDFDVEVTDGVRDVTLDVRAVFGGSLGVGFTRDGKYVSAVVRTEVRDERGRIVGTCAVDQPIGGTGFELPAGNYDVDVTPAGGTKQTLRAAVVAGQNVTLKFELP